MSAALDLDDLTRLNGATLDAMARLGASLEPSDQGSREVFSRQVAAVEALLKQTYQAAALLARRSADCEESARIWKSMADYANQVMVLLSVLKDRDPGCGTGELHDLALDYKAAADKRYHDDLEATLCQKTPLPEGLLPPLTSLA